MAQLERDGYTWIRRALEPGKIGEFQRELERLTKGRQTHGLRTLTKRSALFADEASRSFGLDLPDDDMVCLRGILFAKPKQANWKVPWHRDLTMALPRRTDAPGFTSWTLKEGVHHAQPPLEFLQRVLTLRLHLDTADANNGALRVLPGSHLDGKEMPATLARESQQLLAAEPGDVLLMRPLLLHASSASSSGSQRRILHFDYVPRDALPAEI